MSSVVVYRFVRGSAVVVCAAWVVLLGRLLLAEAPPEVGATAGEESAVKAALSDYATAFAAARQGNRPLVVCFYADGQKDWCDALAARLSKQEGTAVPVAGIGIGEAVRSGGKDVVLSDAPAFARLEGKPGVAIVDFSVPKDSAKYGRAWRVFPLSASGQLSEDQLAAIQGAVAAPGPLSEVPNQPLTPIKPSDRNAMRDEAVQPATALRPILPSLIWLDDYAQATQVAKEEKRMLLVYLVPEGGDQAALRESFEKSLADSAVVEMLSAFVLARLPESAVMRDGDREVALLDHPSLVEMEHKPGLFIVDYESEGEEYFGTVVNVFPFLNGRPYNVKQMKVILTLPKGSLTQRTMIYAVSTHPEHPASVRGRPDPYLFSEAEGHSRYQARICLQGHHFWETRFHRILGRIPPGTLASEVCAESWPGQGLLAAAIECVRCWRLSSGHWRAVSSPQKAYGYDIKRGSNGVWYATGIFAGRN